MEKPTPASKTPYKVYLEKGKIYFWCTCALSKKQPFCDGTHKQKGQFKPLKYTVFESKEVFLCGCKGTKSQPLCDGSHSR